MFIEEKGLQNRWGRCVCRAL